VIGFNVGDEKPPHYYMYVGYLKMEPYVARIRRMYHSRGAREAIATRDGAYNTYSRCTHYTAYHSVGGRRSSKIKARNVV
jgi:hypothetical protein